MEAWRRPCHTPDTFPRVCIHAAFFPGRLNSSSFWQEMRQRVWLVSKKMGKSCIAHNDTKEGELFLRFLLQKSAGSDSKEGKCLVRDSDKGFEGRVECHVMSSPIELCHLSPHAWYGRGSTAEGKMGFCLNMLVARQDAVSSSKAEGRMRWSLCPGQLSSRLVRMSQRTPIMSHPRGTSE